MRTPASIPSSNANTFTKPTLVTINQFDTQERISSGRYSPFFQVNVQYKMPNSVERMLLPVRFPRLYRKILNALFCGGGGSSSSSGEVFSREEEIKMVFAKAGHIRKHDI